MKKAVVTGANGFVGSYVVNELLTQGVYVTAIVRSEKSDTRLLRAHEHLKIVYCDLSNILNLPELIPDRDIDLFYHLAWTGASGKNRADYNLQLNNCKFTCDCAYVAKQLNCKKFVCTGSITEKIAEGILNSDVKAENTVYGIAKHTAHCLLDVICKKLEIPLVWARLSCIYGGNNTTGNIVSYTLGELGKGNVPEFSKAEQPYDLMYVKDTAKALFLLGTRETSKTCYFVGSGQPHILKDYLISIRDMFGESAEIGIGKRPEDGLKYFQEWFKTDDLKRDTGFEPIYSFEAGIKETIAEIKGAFEGRNQ